MQSHQISTRNTSSKKRIGRGGVRGTTSGRGSKGQKARSGGNVDPLFEGGRSSLIMRMKKSRGFTSRNERNIIITLSDLDKYFSNGDVVNRDRLIAVKLLKSQNRFSVVKLLCTGELTKKLTIDNDILTSHSARVFIEKIGGSVASPVEVNSHKKDKKEIKK